MKHRPDAANFLHCLVGDVNDGFHRCPHFHVAVADNNSRPQPCGGKRYPSLSSAPPYHLQTQPAIPHKLQASPPHIGEPMPKILTITLAAGILSTIFTISYADGPAPAAAPASTVYGKPVATQINPGQVITYRSTIQDISAYLVTPRVPADAKTPAVIYIHDIFGMTDFTRAQADNLARQGYTVLAPNLFSRIGGSEHGLNAQTAWIAYEKTPDPQVLSDLLAAVEYLNQEGKSTAGQPLALVGHDMGGIYAMMLAGDDLRITAAVNYYGRVLYTAMSPLRPVSPVEDLFNLRAPLLSFYGTNDPQIPPEQIRSLESRLQNNPNKTYYQVVQFSDVGHSFLVPTRQGYNAKAAAESQEKTRDFLARYLRAEPKKAED
jgi:carboxymethylenebutenolidase